MNAKGITLAVILEHIQSMAQRMDSRMGSFESRLGSLETRMGSLEKGSKGLTEKIDWAYHRLTFQIDALDGRLDDIEIQLLPQKFEDHNRRIKRIERRLKITA